GPEGKGPMKQHNELEDGQEYQQAVEPTVGEDPGPQLDSSDSADVAAGPRSRETSSTPPRMHERGTIGVRRVCGNGLSLKWQFGHFARWGWHGTSLRCSQRVRLEPSEHLHGTESLGPPDAASIRADFFSRRAWAQDLGFQPDLAGFALGT